MNVGQSFANWVERLHSMIFSRGCNVHIVVSDLKVPGTIVPLHDVLQNVMMMTYSMTQMVPTPPPPPPARGHSCKIQQVQQEREQG